ncbi:kinase-like domain-containing protein [Halenospora varia]|nr:kinase-like domain-containing protein [Halenospora varia]
MAFSNNIQSMNNFDRLIAIPDGAENPLTPSRKPCSIDERLGEFFAEGRTGPFTDADLAQISFLLQNSNHPSYSRVPRLYTILRIIDQLEVLDEFLDHDITDLSFPFDAASFPSAISIEIQCQFRYYQSAVLTKALDLEKGERGGHLHFGKGESAPYEAIGKLGSGAYGEVEKVISLLSHQEFARKKISRRTRHLRKNEHGIKSFLAELRVLKRISHNHCVKMIGSYTDHKYLALIMSPVADCNLVSYMEDAANSVDKQSLLRTFFGCLCNGLQYLHQSKIRHRDVKPANILVKGANVLWADFGISLDWADMSRSTTTADSAKSLLYCAPEVANFEPRNSFSDIWSLGCVFLEMTTILKGKTITQMRQSFKGYPENYRFYTNISSVNLWIENLYILGSSQDNCPLKWIKSMLNINQRHRPTAQILSSIITNQTADSDISFNPRMFCGSCCVGDDESSFYSESDGEYWIERPEEQQTLHPYPLQFNVDPVRAQVDQHSAEPESEFHQNRDSGHGSSDTMSNNGNSNVVRLLSPMDIDDDDNNGNEFSPPRDSVDHLQPAHTDPRRNCVFPGCDNDQGKGFPDRISIKKHIRSIHLGQKSNCTFPGCDSSTGKGFLNPGRLIHHILLTHMRQNSDCAFPGCDNNKGKGFSRSSALKGHVQSIHSSQKLACTFPGCDNNKGKGFSNSGVLKGHVQSVHSDQKFACTLPGCDNNKGKGFLRSDVMKCHVRLMHWGMESNYASSSGNNGGEDFGGDDSIAERGSMAHSQELGGEEFTQSAI